MKSIIREQYLIRIRPYYDSDLIKVITGIRRCGKSIILNQIINEIKTKGVDEDRIIYLDLEGISGRDIVDRRSLEDYISQRIKKDGKYYIFIDEIQNLPEFEIAIASIRVSFNCSLFVTGSNSKLLSGKLQDRLTGRAKEFEIYPFTFSEYLEYKKINNITFSDNDFKDYLTFGGLPQRFNENNDVEVRKYLTGLYDSIIKKDVFNNHIRVNKNVFKQVAKYVLSTSGRLFSALSVAKNIKKNATKKEVKSFSATINNYADYLKECYLILECEPFYLKGKERLNGTRKFYAIDVGLRNSLGNVLDLDDTFALEGIIHNELLYRGYEVKYGKLRDGEIDFVAIKNNKKCFIQVAYKIDTEGVRAREYGAFKNIKDGSPRFVFSLDEFDSSNNGITHINIVDFLLNKVDISLS